MPQSEAHLESGPVDVVVERPRGVAADALLALAERLDLPVVDQAPAEGDALILGTTDDGRLEMRLPSMTPGRGVWVDLTPPAAGSGLARRQPLARAIGSGPTTIVDATAGLAQDTRLLLGAGHTVTAIERSPILATLVRDGRRRLDASHPDVASRLTVIEGNAIEVIPSIEMAPEVIFIDPMFPPKRKRSALPPLAVRLVRRLVGADPDAATLVDVACRCATRRTIVKRPDDAAPLRADPTSTHAGKLVRYDVYVTPRT